MHGCWKNLETVSEVDCARAKPACNMARSSAQFGIEYLSAVRAGSGKSFDVCALIGSKNEFLPITRRSNLDNGSVEKVV